MNRDRLASCRERHGESLIVHLRTTVIIWPPELPAASKALTVILLVPTSSGMFGSCQEAVPLATPAPPKVLDQRTAATPTLSDAVPLRLMLAAEVETSVDPGDRICTVGATESVSVARVTRTVFDAVLPAPSLTVTVI